MAAVLPCCCATLLLMAWAPMARAQAWVPGKRNGSVGFTYQQSKSSRLTSANSELDRFGEVIDRSLSLNVDYGLTDRWAFSASIPFTSNRYRGNDPHDPRPFPFLADQRFLDDGRFHDGWADWAAYLRYQWRAKPFLVTPYIGYSQPSRDYTFWAHSGAGSQQWALHLGVHLGGFFSPPRQNLYWQAAYDFSFLQPVSHRRVNRGVVSVGIGYYFTPRFNVQALIEHQNSYGDTINLPDDFSNPDGSPNIGNIIYHDQLAASRTTTASAGLGYRINDRYALFANYGRTLTAANAHIYDGIVTVGFNREF